MKKIALLLAVTLLLGMAVSAQAATLKVGMECNYAPFNWTQATASDMSVPIAGGGFADGYDVQIARKIASALGMDLEIVKTEWDGLPLALIAGSIDAIIAGMSPTAERALSIDFTAPYYESDLVIVVRKDGPYAGATSLADFKGAAITGQLNTFHYTVIPQIPEVNALTAMETFPAMIVALQSGAIDGYISERPGAMAAAASNPDLTFISFAEGMGFVASPEDVAVAVGLQKGSPLLASINDVLAGIDKATRQQMMDDAIARQPLAN
jgi:putative lysine transport system substrate-binding protein